MITFKCVECGYPVVVDNLNPHEETEIVTCQGCGRRFGTYAEVVKALLKPTRPDSAKMIDEAGPLPWMLEK